MKKILLVIAVLLAAAFILKSCFSNANLCGSNDKDLVRPACEKTLQKS